MKTIFGIVLGLILVSSVFVGNASAFDMFDIIIKSNSMATASLEECSALENIYVNNVGTVNNAVSGRFGTEEVSQRVADHVTNGGTASDSIGVANSAAKELVDKCLYSENSVKEVLGDFNQNIIDSVTIYKNMNIKDIRSSYKQESKSQTKSNTEVKKDTKKDAKKDSKKKTDTKKKTKEVKKTVKSETKKKEVKNGKTGKKIVSDECNSAASTYIIKRGEVNFTVMERVGWQEVSQSVADYVMKSFITDDISDMNKAANVLIEKCGYQSYDDIRKDLGGLNHNIIDSVKQYGHTDIRNIIKKKMSLDDCTTREMIYRENVAATNIDGKTRFGTEEISQRVADHFISGDTATDSIVMANKASRELIANCDYHSDDVVKEVLGGFNQNIIDSVKQYKNMRIQDIN